MDTGPMIEALASEKSRFLEDELKSRRCGDIEALKHRRHRSFYSRSILVVVYR